MATLEESSLMTLIRFLYRHSRALFIVATVTSLISGISGAAVIGVISEAVARTTVPSAGVAWTFFGACLVYLACKSASEISLLNLTENAICHLRVSLSYRILATPIKTLQAFGKDSLLVTLTRDIDIFVHAFQLLPLAFGNVVIILCCLGYMAFLSWPVFLIFVICLVLSTVSYHLVERRPLARLVAVRAQLDVLYKNFRSLIDGSKELQLNAGRGQRFVQRVLSPAAVNYKQLYKSTMATYIWVGNVGAVLFYLVIGSLVFLVPLWLPQSSQVLIANTFILLYLIRPITEMMAILPELRQAHIALNRIQRLESDLNAIAVPRIDNDPFDNSGPLRLQLSGVCHDYPSDDGESSFTIGPLDLAIGAGEVVFLVGGNGSGKTTLAMLLLGLYDAQRGTLALNGVAVNAENQQAYCQYFSAVFADFHLFKQLLVEEEQDLNVRASGYLDRLQMGHKVQIVDGEFSTIALSTGQRKRLALIASYLEDRPIYLFDEWAADQDPAFKRVFYTELLPELRARGKAVIVITHDDAYFDCADRVYKLDEGRLTERTHARAAYAAARPEEMLAT